MKYKIYILILILLVVFGIYYFSRTKSITNFPSKGVDIIAFGDSLVEGVGSTKDNNFYMWNIYNFNF